MSNAAVEVVIAPARFYKPVDGDTFDLLVNFRRRRSWREATVVYVRLKGYMARESTGALKNTPQLDPATGDVIRVSGIEAKRIATDVLTTATMILVEFTGAVSEGRDVCAMWVTLPGETAIQPLGAVLVARRVVLPGDSMGVHE